MPKRLVDTAVWADPVFGELEPRAQLVYLRLITGEDTGPHGATRAPTKRLAADTNLTRDDVAGAITELLETPLLRRYDDWLWMPNWIRYQAHSPNFLRAARHAARECPDALRIAIGRAIDTHAPRKTPTEPDGTRTRKPADSSTNTDPSPTLDEPIPNPSGTIREKGQGQGQGQGQVPSSRREEEGTGTTDTDAANAAPAASDQTSEPRPTLDDLEAIGGTVATVAARLRTTRTETEHRTTRKLPPAPTSATLP